MHGRIVTLRVSVGLSNVVGISIHDYYTRLEDQRCIQGDVYVRLRALLRVSRRGSVQVAEGDKAAGRCYCPIRLAFGHGTIMMMDRPRLLLTSSYPVLGRGRADAAGALI